MSTEPKRAMVASTQREAASLSPALAACQATVPGSSAAACSSGSAFRDDSITLAPDAARASGNRLADPRSEAPVTSATCPSSRRSTARTVG